MREMKDSGVEWIGEIPEDWEVVTMKNCFSQRDGGAWGENPVGDEFDYVCLRIADFNFNRFVFKDTEELTIRNYTENQIKKLKLLKNDILIEKSGGGEKTPVGRVVIFDKNYNALYANFMDRLRCNDFVNPKFMIYNLVTFYCNEYVKNYIKQTTGIQNLDLTGMLSKENITLPSYDEQEKIANYLDQKCEKIDSTIEKQGILIEKLKEYKQALITETVTKGLNDNVEMVESGVEWIGKIPSHWDITSIGKVATIFRGASPRPAGDPKYFDGKDVPWITVAEVTKGVSNFILDTETYLTFEGAKKSRVVESGTLLLSNSGATLGVPKVTKIRGCINDGSVAFTNLNLNQIYLLYILKSRTMELRRQMQGYGQPNLNTNIVKSIEVPLPLIEEQQQIADYLDKKCEAIDKAIEQKQQVVEKLTEYKKSLIYEVVTGKKEV